MSALRRRDFLSLTGLGLGSSLFGCTASRTMRTAGHASRPDGLLKTLVELNDARIPGLVERQLRDPRSRHFGGIADRYGLYKVGTMSGFVRDLASAYVSPGGRFEHDGSLVAPLLDATKFLLEAQHEDGTVDLLTTNYHSTPDVAFVFEWICAATGILRSAKRSELDGVLANLDEFLVRGRESLIRGGIHTPNHRWVVCMALARVHTLHPDPRCLARIDEWLAEKIDIDADGQYTEHSTSVYSPLTDRWLITLARLLNRPALLEPVRKNLDMTLYYLHANGEVATEGSKRQDRNKPGYVWRYYFPYRSMALVDGDGRFAAVARWIEDNARQRLSGNLVFFLEDPNLTRELPERASLPTDYERGFTHSGLVRIRRGKTSATIVADSPIFFSLHEGCAAVVVRFASAFFGKGQFEGANLRKAGDTWILEQDLVGPYYQPLPAELLPGDGDWSKMPRARRPQSEVQRLHSEARITERDGGFDLEIRIDGCADVPVAVELGFRHDGVLQGVTPVEGIADAHLLEAGLGEFTVDGDTIRFGPGRVTHRWTALRGALPKLDAQSVFLTGQTPLQMSLRLE